MYIGLFPDSLYTNVSIILITVGVVCSVVRWFHVCEPYKSDSDYYYPARKQVALCYLAMLFQIPYCINVNNEHVWLYICAFGIMFYPFGAMLILSQYFKRFNLDISQFRKTFIITVGLIIATIIISLALSCFSELINIKLTIILISAIVSIMFSVRYFEVAKSLKKKIKLFQESTFSNVEDFPYLFALKIIYIPLILIVLMWIIFITGNRDIKMITDLMLSIWFVWLLINILHTHFYKVDKIENDINDIAVDNNEIRKSVLLIISQKYFNPNLQRSDVIADIEYGKKTVAGNIITELGFYNLVNALRLKYSIDYKSKHPNTTQDDVAESSGFSSRFALIHAKKKISDDKLEYYFNLYKNVKIDIFSNQADE